MIKARPNRFVSRGPFKIFEFASFVFAIRLLIGGARGARLNFYSYWAAPLVGPLEALIIAHRRRVKANAVRLVCSDAHQSQ
jgi:hypothetical protein